MNLHKNPPFSYDNRYLRIDHSFTPTTTQNDSTHEIQNRPIGIECKKWNSPANDRVRILSLDWRVFMQIQIFINRIKNKWYINRDLFHCLNIISDTFDIFYIFIRHMYRARSCAFIFSKNSWKSAIYLSCFSFFVCITVRYYGNASTNLHCGNTIGGVLSASATNRWIII